MIENFDNKKKNCSCKKKPRNLRDQKKMKKISLKDDDEGKIDLYIESTTSDTNSK